MKKYLVISKMDTGFAYCEGVYVLEASSELEARKIARTIEFGPDSQSGLGNFHAYEIDGMALPWSFWTR